MKLGPSRTDDGLALADPSGWGFCDICAFEVAVVDGVRIRHRYDRLGHNETICPGSGEPPVAPTPVEAKARPIIRLRKNPIRAKKRAAAQRRRWEDRGVLRPLAATTTIGPVGRIIPREFTHGD